MRMRVSKILFLLLFIPTGLIGLVRPDDLSRLTPLVTPSVTGPTEACSNTGGYVYTTDPGMTNYSWAVSPGGIITGGGGTNVITVTWIVAGPQTITISYFQATTPAVLNVMVQTSLAVGITTLASANPVCAGVPVTFTAFPVNGGVSPTYEWRVNNVSAGVNSAVFVYYPGSGDIVTCQFTSDLLCPTGNPANSIPISMTVIPNTPVSVSISASANPVCSGDNVLFTAIPVNGGVSPFYQWKVNSANAGTNSAQFSYSPVSGDQVTCTLTSPDLCVSGNPATSNVIIMTVSENLPVSVTINGSANPSCLGEPVVYTATPLNGGIIPVFDWKINGNSQGSNTPVFTFTPVSGYELTCQLTSNAGCTSNNPAISNVLTMTVKPYAPVSLSISVSANPVCNGTPVTFTATPGNGGSDPVYEWLVNGSTVGINSPVYTYIPTGGDVVTCQLTSNELCITGNPATSNQITMTVSSTVVPGITISASGNPACQGMLIIFTASPVNGGTTPGYQWKVNGLDVGGNAPVFSYFPANGDQVTCRLTSNSLCATGSAALSNTISMSVSPMQQVGVSVTVQVNPVCQGSSASFTALPVNGGALPQYNWQVNGISAGTNNPGFTYVPANNDVVKCVLTSGNNCTSGNPATSSGIVMGVSLNLPVSITINASVNPVCQGQTVTYSAVPVNGGLTPLYLWQVNGVNMMSGPSFTYVPGNGDLVRCFLTSGNACATGSPATSNTITMTVNPMQVVSVSIVSSANPSCQGASVTYTATPVNGGSSPVYQWKVNGVDAGGNLPVYVRIPVQGDIITCQLMSDVACPVTNPVISNNVYMVVTSIVGAAISIVPSGNPVCTGTQVTFSATVANGGSFPGYQWKVNGALSGANSPILTFIPLNGDVVTCQLTSNLPCVSGNPVTSDPVTMISSTPLPGTISIFPSANPFCNGASVTFTTSITNGGISPGYEWKVNGIVRSSGNPAFSYLPVNGDFVSCQLTPSLSCTTGPVTSNPVYMSMANTVPAGIAISASVNPVCTANPVTYTASATNGGPAPAYQWRVNHAPVGSNSPTYSYIPSNGDSITCMLTSNAACVSGNPITSVALVQYVSAGMAASIYISTPVNPYCLGSAVTYTATQINGGSLPAYQWKVNGGDQGTNSSVFTFLPSNGDVVSCVLSSNSSCLSGSNPVVSNPIVMAGSSTLPASVTISVSVNPVCQGTTAILTAVPANGGAVPAYQWKVNGMNKGSNNHIFAYVPVNGDIVSCQMTSDLVCATANPAISNLVTMIVSTAIAPLIAISSSVNPSCQGTTVTFTATTSNGGTSPEFRWRVNGLMTGTNLPSYSYIPLNGDAVTCQIMSNINCNNGTPIISNQVVMTVNSEQPVAVTVVPSQNPFCPGSLVTFTANPVNGGSAPEYTWKVNGNSEGTNNQVFTYAPANGDIVTCLLTSNKTCISNNPALSNPVTVIADEGMPVGVSISASLNPICQGTLVMYTATPVYGGTSPVYHWKVNGVVTGSNLAYLYYYPIQGDVITCEMTSSLTCVSGNPGISNAIGMTVIPGAPVAVTVAVSSNPSCLGNSVCYTADLVNGGTSPIYRWKVNSVNKGTNSPTFCYVPVNGDIVGCRVTSNEVCATNNPSNSNNIVMSVLPVSPATVSITASANPVCQGTPVTFTASPFNGGVSPVYQWRRNGIIIGTNSEACVFIPSNGDVVTCQMMSDAYCVTTNTVTSNAISMTVSPYLPVSVSIASPANPVCQGSNNIITAYPVNGGIAPIYQWTVNGINAGIHSPTFVSVPLDGDVVACQLTSDAACTLGNPATSLPVTMSVIPNLPVSITIAASAAPSCQGPTVTYSANATNGGPVPAFQWLINGINVGTDSTYTYMPTNGDAVMCQLVSNISCVSGNPAISNQINMNFFPYLSTSISITCSANPACEGIPVTYTANPVNGGNAPVFQWKVNGVNRGGGLSSYTFFPDDGDIVTCELTSSVSCPIQNPVLSNSISMAVLMPQETGVTLNVSNNPVCVSIPVTFTAIPSNGGSYPVYQWFVNGAVAGSNLSTYTYVPATGDVVLCHLTSSVTCVTNGTVISNPVTMIVSSDFPASLSITASSNPACQGEQVTYTAVPINGGSNPIFIWRNNGIVVGSNSPNYTCSPTNGDLISCQLFSSFPCASGSPASSNQIPIIVNPNIPVSVSISGSFNPACVGVPIIFTAVPVNGGATPVFQWKVNGQNEGTNLPVFTYEPGNGDLVSCILSSSQGCVSGNPALSNPVNMIIGSTFPVNVSIVASDNPICQQTPVTFTATSSFGGPAPAFLWKKNGLVAGTNSTVYACSPADGDVITCTMTSQLVCAVVNPVTSNAISIIVLPVPVSLSIAALQAFPVCSGTPVTYLSYPVNGGPIPTFFWKVNGAPAGTNSASFTYPPQTGDTVTCMLTSNATCAAGNTATSNAITANVNPGLPVAISIVPSPGSNLCEGTMATVTAIPVNEGTGPVFQWKLNGTDVGINASEMNYTPVNGDVITCTVTSDITCPTGNPAVSEQLPFTVSPIVPVTVQISASPQGPVCASTNVAFTAATLNGGPVPEYHWKINGIDAGTNSQILNYISENGDGISCEVHIDIGCPDVNPAVSNTIGMEVSPNLPVSVSISTNPSGIVCKGTVVSFTAVPVNGGSLPVYHWTVNGLSAGINDPVFTYIPINGDVIVCEIVSDVVCPTGNPAVSDAFTMQVAPDLPVSLIIDANPGMTVCSGTTVVFMAVAVNGGVSPIYSWKVNGQSSGVNNAEFSFIPADGDIITCELNSSLRCRTGNPAGSNALQMTVNQNIPVGISISSFPSGVVCHGTQVTFSASTFGGGLIPVFQWKVNGDGIGTNNSSFAYIPANGDKILCEVTSGTACVTGNPTVSNSIEATVNPGVTVGVTVVASPSLAVCTGIPVNFTANPVNGGNGPVYLWQVNGTTAGTSGSLFSYTPLTGDVVTCMLTSNETCTVNNPVTSNPVTITLSPSPVVNLMVCNDLVTTVNANPFRLKGGLPLSGTYSGPGVNPVTGMFNPAMAGAGTHQITYSYTNIGSCTSSSTEIITVQPIVPFTCGSGITDPRDNQLYPTVLIGAQCWLAKNLNYGTMISSQSPQMDNCLVSKYCPGDLAGNCSISGGFYQWDELMGFDATPGGQGLCLPGWHIPGEAEWVVLFNQSGGQSQAAIALKDSAPGGFKALLSGVLYQNNTWAFTQAGISATFFWTSDSAGATGAKSHGINNISASLSDYSAGRGNGMSVRCLKD